MTLKELFDLLQKHIEDGKGDYIVRSSEYENHKIDEDYFHIDDENNVFWYEA